MSYCRFSSDDYQCDVYVWEDVSGYWRTEVAGRRRVLDTSGLPSVPSRDESGFDKWFKALMARHAAMDALLRAHDDGGGEWVSLPEIEGGNAYAHETPGECADNLERLRDTYGLNVPQYAIDALREDDTEMAR